MAFPPDKICIKWRYDKDAIEGMASPDKNCIYERNFSMDFVKHKIVFFASMALAVIASILSIVNLVLQMMNLCNELTAKHEKDMFNKMLMAPLNGAFIRDMYETPLYKIGFFVLGIGVILLIVSFFLNTESKGLKTAMLVVRGVQAAGAVFMTLVHLFVHPNELDLILVIPALIILAAEIAAVVLYWIDRMFFPAALLLIALTGIVVCIQVVYGILLVLVCVLILSLFWTIISIFTPLPNPWIAVYDSAGRFIGYIQDPRY